MARLLIGNDADETLVDSPRRTGITWWAQRVLWFARDDDVIVLPGEPDAVFLDYVTSLTGTKASSLRVIVPPRVAGATESLTADRLADPYFLAALRAALAEVPVDRVLPLWPDATVAELAGVLGLAELLPGHDFLLQGGNALANSKAVFRATATGAGVAIPEGVVCSQQNVALAAITNLLDQGHVVMVKREFLWAGDGNEILTRVAGVNQIGARRTVMVPDRSAVADYLAENWDYLTNSGRDRLVVERYFPDSVAVFAEFTVDETGVFFGGQGRLISIPVAAAQIMPAVGLADGLLAELLDGGRRLCDSLRVLGYRGTVSADAIVTPDGELYFTEYNGRITGSTHVYDIIGKHIVGGDCAHDRVLFEYLRWPVPSFTAAVERIAEAGLDYTPATRTGVVLLSAHYPEMGTVSYCVVADTLEMAAEYEQKLALLFAHESPHSHNGVRAQDAAE